MKKTIILFIATLLCALMARAEGNIVTKADRAYATERYHEALRLYLEEMSSNGTSSDLYYNIANTYYKLNDASKAILNYERALLLNPANAEARANLDFVRMKMKISEDTGASFFSYSLANWVGHTSSDTWAEVAAVLFILFLAAVALYVFVSNVVLRKVGFFGGALLLVLCVLSVACAFYMRNNAIRHNRAVVMVPQATLSTAPHSPAPSEVAFKLKAGQKVHIQDSVKNSTAGQSEVWYNIETADAKKAWINSTDIEKI